MRHLATKLLAFSTPFIIWLIIILLVDPYNYNNTNRLNIIDTRLKYDISYKLNRPLYQLLEYKNHPNYSILLGDSRANSLNCELFKKYSKKSFVNLAYGGGSLQEIINTFWLVAENEGLKDVYIGLNFSLYNNFNHRDRVTEAKEIMKNLFSYSFSTYSFESTYLILKSLITDEKVNIGVPTTTKEKFWMYQLNVSAKQDYEFYEYPSKYFNDLKEISRYCEANKINLVFFIPPTHIDLQNKVKEYSLQQYETKFKSDLRELGELYDFDYPSELTMNKDNFNDPYHFTSHIGENVVKELFSKEHRRYAKYSKNTF